MSTSPSLRDTLKRLTPPPLLTLARETRDAVQRAAQWPGAALHPWRRESIARLSALKDIHKGERCFIIGNGPSLKRTDVSKLRNEHTFGMNRIYLAFPGWGFRTSFLVSVNDLVIEQCVDDFLALDMPRFFSWRSHKFFTHALRSREASPQGGTLSRSIPARGHVPVSRPPSPVFLHTTYTGPKFATDVTGRLWEGATVTYVCLQLAFHLGFEQAILIGVDHSFVSKGKPNTTVISNGDDPNHFDARYFGKGFRWQLPDLASSEVGYLMARQAYQSAGREVLDATIGGKLQIFPKVEYGALFE